MSKRMKHSEKLAHKYKYLREKIIESYRKGCRILDISKIVFTFAFLVFTFFCVTTVKDTSDKTAWLMLWIIIILIAVNIFLITDYCRYLMKNQVIPYLMDDDCLDFNEYLVFTDNDDEEDDEDDGED